MLMLTDMVEVCIFTHFLSLESVQLSEETGRGGKRGVDYDVYFGMVLLIFSRYNTENRSFHLQ